MMDRRTAQAAALYFSEASHPEKKKKSDKNSEL